MIASATTLPVEQFERECRDLAQILSGDAGTTRQQRNRQNRKVRRWVALRLCRHMNFGCRDAVGVR